MVATPHGVYIRYFSQYLVSVCIHNFKRSVKLLTVKLFSHAEFQQKNEFLFNDSYGQFNMVLPLYQWQLKTVSFLPPPCISVTSMPVLSSNATSNNQFELQKILESFTSKENFWQVLSKNRIIIETTMHTSTAESQPHVFTVTQC